MLLALALVTSMYFGEGDRVVHATGHQRDGRIEVPETIYTAHGGVVGVVELKGSLYVISHGTYRDDVFRLDPGSKPGDAWTRTWLWSGCLLLNCDDGDHATQVWSTPDGSWGWRNRDGGWWQHGTVMEWDFKTRSPRIWTVKP